MARTGKGSCLPAGWETLMWSSKREKGPEAGGGGRKASWRRWDLSGVVEIAEELERWARKEEGHFRQGLGEQWVQSLGNRNGAGMF